MANRTLKDAYQVYLDTGGTLSQSVYREVCGLFNTMVMERIIYNAEAFNMGFRLSTLQVVRRSRKHFQFAIDWKASYDLKKEILARGGSPKTAAFPEGEKWLIYRDTSTDDYYVGFHWKKSRVTITNKTAYRFDATRGNKGNKSLLSQHASNQLNIFDYDHK